MNRSGLLIAFGVAAAVGLIFGAYPELDLKLSALFFDATGGGWRSAGIVDERLRKGISWSIALIAAPAFLALGLKLVMPRRPLLLSGRAIAFLIGTLALAPGLVANVLIKDNSGRPRPGYVSQFGGNEQFLPWWDMRGPCDKNCSFVAGEPSGAFWTLAPAALAPPAWRPIAYGAAIVFGALVGVLRIAAGGHFVTDVAFAGVLTFLLIWFVHGLLYRWRATRISDESIERALERVATPTYDAVLRLAERIGSFGLRNKGRRGT